MTRRDRFGTRVRDARLALCLTPSEAARGIVTNRELAEIEAGYRDASGAEAAALAHRMAINDETPSDPCFASALQTEAHLRRGDWLAASDSLTGLDPTSPQFFVYSALVIERRGRFADAIEQLQRALGHEGGEPWRRRATVALARCARSAGQHELSISIAEQALASGILIDDPEHHAELRATLAGTYCETGDVTRALDMSEPMPGQDANPWMFSTQRWSRAMVLQSMGRTREAATAAFEALHVLERLDQPRTVARMQNNAAWMAMQSPAFDTGLIDGLLSKADATLRALQANFDLAFVMSTRAELEAMRRAPELASRFARESLALSDSEDAGVRARIRAAAAQVYASIGEIDESMQLLLSARELLESTGARRSAAGTWKQMAATYEALGQQDLQLACLRAAMDLLDL